MAKKNWTDEERKAFGAKMKAAREKKELENNPSIKEQIVDIAEAQQSFEGGDPATDPDGDPQVTIADNNDMSAILARIQELEATNFRLMSSQMNQNAPQMGRTGKLMGSFEKYPLNPANYPDPSERLAKEPKLARFAFDINYELDWKISVSEYENIEGVRIKEPKFTLELVRVILDEITGEPTSGRYTVCRLILHEDPAAALVVAAQNGLVVDEQDEPTFLNEMRYLAMRDWLVECFYPAVPNQEKKNKKDMVIGGQMVEYFEVNSEEANSIPFGQLKNKLR